MYCSFYGAFVAAGVVFGLILSGCDTQVARQTPSTQQETHEKSGESRTAEVEKQPLTEPAASNQTVANSESPVQQERDQPGLTGEQPRTDSSDDPSDEPDDPNENDQSAPEEQQTIEIPDTWKRLSKEHEIWVDMKNKQVMVAGNIVLAPVRLRCLYAHDEPRSMNR